jgi:hypothetical protein
MHLARDEPPFISENNMEFTAAPRERRASFAFLLLSRFRANTFRVFGIHTISIASP